MPEREQPSHWGRVVIEYDRGMFDSSSGDLLGEESSTVRIVKSPLYGDYQRLYRVEDTGVTTTEPGLVTTAYDVDVWHGVSGWVRVASDVRVDRPRDEVSDEGWLPALGVAVAIIEEC